MTFRKPLSWFLAAGLAASSPSLGQTRGFTGRILAYDPTYHTFKQSSFVKNKEVVIFQLNPGHHRAKYIKLVFESFGPKQLEMDLLEGEATMTVRAIRDTACDQASPEFVSETNFPEQSGKFQLSKHFRSEPPPTIADLRCYLVREDK